MKIVITSELIYTLTFLVGIVYAMLITIRPKWFRIPDQYTFVAVIIGVLFTNVFIHILIAMQGNELNWIFMNVWWPYFLTGWPMVAAQILKLIFENREADMELAKAKQQIAEWQKDEAEGEHD